jgi:hypothetical protein
MKKTLTDTILYSSHRSIYNAVYSPVSNAVRIKSYFPAIDIIWDSVGDIVSVFVWDSVNTLIQSKT